MEVFGIEKLLDQQIEDERIRRCLHVIMKEKSADHEFKENFLKKNKNWYVNLKRFLSNIRKILTPATIFKHRTTLTAKLQGINGSLHGEGDLTNFNKKTRQIPLLDLNEKGIIKETVGASILKVIRLWKWRARKLILIRSQIAGVLEQHTEPQCIYCGQNWGLKCESIDNVEEQFEKYVNERRLRISEGWPTKEWQEYFQRHSVFRTICYACHNALLPQVEDCSFGGIPFKIQQFLEFIESKRLNKFATTD